MVSFFTVLGGMVAAVGFCAVGVCCCKGYAESATSMQNIINRFFMIVGVCVRIQRI